MDDAVTPLAQRVAERQVYNAAGLGMVRPEQFDRFEARDTAIDPRGIPWVLEPPRTNCIYIMGVDPTVGIEGWDRHCRTKDDFRVDNAAIEIIRVGGQDRDGMDLPDTHVFDWAAPVDIYQLARVANLWGRIYGGSNEDGQCLCIVEAYPGPGLPAIHQMVNAYGYTNHYVWKYQDRMTLTATHSLGFYATKRAVQQLWIRSKHHMSLNGGVRNLSPYLIEEAADCEDDPILQWGKSASGLHDDRVRALMLALWAAHDWSLDVETERHEVTVGPKAPSWQASDVSSDRLADLWEERFQELLEG